MAAVTDRASVSIDLDGRRSGGVACPCGGRLGKPGCECREPDEHGLAAP
jgi:hypothetical protein